MKKTIVIITHSNDNASVLKVSEQILSAGLDVFRFNSDQYPTRFLIDARSCNGRYTHTLHDLEGNALEQENIHSIWHRRFYAGKEIDAGMEQQMRSACVEEARRSLLGFLTCSTAFQMDDYWTVRKASNKDYQLKIASEIGLLIPATLVTNNEQAARLFYDEMHGELITKMQSAFSIWEEGIEKVVFTNPVEERHLEKLDGLLQCPMVFQQKIAKKLELRVTIVGQNIFCAAIDSNSFESMENDWRKRGIDTLDAWFAYQLPESLEQQLLTLMRSLGLSYGAIDLILTPNEEIVFLEINPCGEFYWMDHYTGLDICSAIAQTLVNNSN